MKTILTLGLLASIGAVPAMAESFTRDGETYNYSVKSAGEYYIISGKAASTGKSFYLRVKGEQVSGTFGASPVHFRMPAAAESTTVLASK
jgi:hypothetical protein